MALTEDDDFSGVDAVSMDSTWTRDIEYAMGICSQEWGLEIGAELKSGLNGYAVSATLRDGTAAVLKLRRPDANMRTQADALELFNGKGVVELMQRDNELGATLLRRVYPGAAIAHTQEFNEVDDVVAKLLAKLDGAEVGAKPITLADRCERWAWNLARFDENTPLERHDIQQAAVNLRMLAASQGASAVLHGNVHVGNIISDQKNEWLAIGPKGFIGERLFDLAWWFRDPPTAGRAPMAVDLKSRLDTITEAFDIDEDRLFLWAEAGETLLVAARVAAMMSRDAARHAECVHALRSLR